MPSLLHKMLLLIVALVILGACANQDRYISFIPVTEVPDRAGQWYSGRKVYQTTQPIGLGVTAGFLTSDDMGSLFTLENTTTGHFIFPQGSVLQLGTQTGNALDSNIDSTYAFLVSLYPYAGRPQMVNPGINRLVLSVDDQNPSVLAQDNAFEVLDFNTFWHLGSAGAPASRSTFWFNGTVEPTQASDGSVLISTGVGSAILYR